MIKQLFKSIHVVFKYAPCATIIKFFQIIITAIISPLALFFTQKLIDSMVLYINGNNSISIIMLWGGLLLLTVFIAENSILIDSIQRINIQRNLNQGFTESIINKFKKIEFSCFEDSEIQDTLNRMGNAPQDMILEIFLNVLEIISLIITIIGLMVFFAQVSAWFSFVFIVILIITIKLDFKAMYMVDKMFNSQTEEERRMGYLSELLSNKDSLLELKIFGVTEYITAIWKKKAENVLNERLKTTIRSQKYFAVSGVCVLLWIAIMVFVLIYSVINSKISVGIFVALVSSLTSTMNTINALSQSCVNLSRRYLRMRHYEIFCELPEIVENEIYSENLGTRIIFDNVYFKYPNTETPILNGVSFEINLNEHVAIVGENGAGKSTIIKLLCRLYRPDSGKITVDGKDINTLSQNQLKKIVSVVFQDFVNYSLTMRENVALGNIEKLNDDEAIYTALRMSLATDICDNLNVNLGKIEDNGLDLSGGQWQRIAIARAYIASSNFIILDEPTAALDPIAESELYNTFTKIIKNKGCIFISHRLASAKMADKIILINEGKVAESGSHDELLRRNSIYATMWRLQSEWYKDGGVCE